MPSDAPGFDPIADYGLIGDCGSVALVSRRGSIDWLCWPRFDSPACFAALLDPRRGGHFRVGPAEAPARVERRYAGDTNVLETTFHLSGGLLRLRDLMPVAPAGAYRRAPWPEHWLLREVVCLEGEVEVEVDCAPRFDFGARKVEARDRGACGFFFVHRGSAMVARSEIPLRASPEACLGAGSAWAPASAASSRFPTTRASPPSCLPWPTMPRTRSTRHSPSGRSGRGAATTTGPTAHGWSAAPSR